MSTMILNNADWFRTVERQHGCQEYTGTPLKSSYVVGSNPCRPGNVAVIRNGAVELADDAIDGGAFFGLFYSEFTSDLDETQGKTIDPVLLRGPGTVKVWNAALDIGGSTYALSGTQPVDLCVDGGKLVPRGLLTGPTVAQLLHVHSDGIVILLNAPDSDAP